MRTQTHEELELSDEVNQKLFELQQKGIDVNELILEMLQKRELEIAQEKEQISTKLTQANSSYAEVRTCTPTRSTLFGSTFTHECLLLL